MFCPESFNNRRKEMSNSFHRSLLWDKIRRIGRILLKFLKSIAWPPLRFLLRRWVLLVLKFYFFDDFDDWFNHFGLR